MPFILAADLNFSGLGTKDLHRSAPRAMNGDAMQNNEQDTIEDGPEPFVKCQRCQKREADLTTAAGEKVCDGCATRAEVANGNAA
jgi:hypothetical protein